MVSVCASAHGARRVRVAPSSTMQRATHAAVDLPRLLSLRPGKVRVTELLSASLSGVLFLLRNKRRYARRLKSHYTTSVGNGNINPLQAILRDRCGIGYEGCHGAVCH